MKAEIGLQEVNAFGDLRIRSHNSHDGSMAITAAVTPIRIMCANTLGAALGQTESFATGECAL